MHIDHDDVVLCPYDPQWSVEYEVEKASLLTRLENDGFHPTIYHVGSTSICGMTAKPIIDILILLPTEEEVQESILALIGSGFAFLGDGGRIGRYFFSGVDGAFPHYLHVTTADNQVAKDQLMFKDLLQSSQKLTNDYIAVKQQAAELYPHDRTKYREMKGLFIDAVLRAYEIGKNEHSTA